MLKQKIKAFTLIELLITMVILAILGTITFLAFKGYSASARDARRISEIDDIEKVLELYKAKAGRYPEPDNIQDVTYTGNTVWSQGEVGETVVSNLIELGDIPLDPLLEEEYVYSLLNTKKEFELGTIFEGDNLSYNITKTYAAKNSFYTYIKGNYNGKVAKLKLGNSLYVFAIPSIIGSDLTDSDISSLVEKKLFVYNGYKNIPANYSGMEITMTGSFDFGGIDSDLLVYTGSLYNLSNNYQALESFGEKLKDAYSGSVLVNESKYSIIVNMDTTDSNQLQNIAGNIVLNNLGGKIAQVSN